MTTLLSLLPWLFLTGGADDAAGPAWSFDPNTLKLEGAASTGEKIIARLRPTGNMHGIVIESLGDAPSPTSPDRAFLNLEHYLETGRWAEYLPRKLDHTACLNRAFAFVRFPQPPDWPLTAQLSYTFDEPGAIDAKLAFNFDVKLSQFEVYFTSYMARPYQRQIRVGGKWIDLDSTISDREQLLIPRDDKVASRFEDGRWGFLKGRIRLSEQRFDIPVMISRDPETRWTIVQMVEPGACTHIAPNRFAVGHNFIIGGWDVKPGERRSARMRMLFGRDLDAKAIEKAYERFRTPPGDGNRPGE